MVQYFAVFLILSFSDGSLGTTTSPQQQNTAKLKDLCQRSMLGFPGIPGSNGIPGVPGVPGPHGPQGMEGVKGQIGDKGSQGMPGPRGDRGRQGPPGKSGPRGIKGMKGQQGLLAMKRERGIAGMKGEQGAVGMKGERGIVGNQGRKGDKGEKGESTSVVPQTNWKQCVWKSEADTSNGMIKDSAFDKLQSNSVLRVSFQGNMKENVILGSDYPFPLGEHHPGKLIENVYKDDLELRDKLLGGNALRFLGLKRSQFDEVPADKADAVES